MKKTMVISGFPGIGKTSAANNRTNVIDMESSIFSWKFDAENASVERNLAFPLNYVAAIKEKIALEKYDFIFVSSHQNVREALKAEGIRYIIVAPKEELRNEYLKRYLQRGSDMDFVESLYDGWYTYLKSIWNDGAPVICLDAGEFLADVLGCVVQ